MLNEKKFKNNEKKDIHDFGVLISFLCNPIDKDKKDVKGKPKSINHLPSTFS